MAEPTQDYSGVRRGDLRAGERVTLTDPKGRRHSIVLAEGAKFHTAKGVVDHDELIGRPEGRVVRSLGGTQFLVLRPLLGEFTTTMPRGAAVVYPKDAAQIVTGADIFPGARVIEAGAGSGALTLSLLRAIGPTGRLISYERRQDFAEVAARNVRNFLGAEHPAWTLITGDLVERLAAEDPGQVDRVVLDMLAPWDCVEAAGRVLVPGGVFCCYVATVTQLGRVVETLRVHGGYTEPEATESIIRGWQAEGLAIRPQHTMVGHTGFLITSRRLAPGETAPVRKRRPAPGAYGADYDGPRAAGQNGPTAPDDAASQDGDQLPGGSSAAG
ncbi:tRNA (adenine57-N1/adenine58-N1)-methyltransferase [Microlunatus parietis]|uniref:tRNA (adenine(58)-N(1))-methyltransferase TrmI n=1 Tax=Microlunatus parietis TaxID=682979 RepID=A0A7Y9I2I3_9ACTN|nr:tRNA (adenine-N1)-methyltransferase [Microlunatus parietis]NYE69039.1 tRNA (adenine57-N1/adenine58-N1)-methyltransferase [Microlunatus parietis]